MHNSKMSIREICGIAIMTAVTAVLAQIMIPLPGGVPISLQTFAVMLAGMILGPKYGMISVLVYLLLGAVGLPVFAGFRAGMQAIVSPTGGFLSAFPFLAFCSGMGRRSAQKKKRFPMSLLLFIGIGTLMTYLIGSLWFCVVMKSDFLTAIAICVVPFLIGDILKIFLAVTTGNRLCKRLEIALR